jgi:hypothetical protein
MRFQSLRSLPNILTVKLATYLIARRADWIRNQPFFWSMEVKDG